MIHHFARRLLVAGWSDVSRRSSTHYRRARLARDLLRERHRAFAEDRDGKGWERTPLARD